MTLKEGVIQDKRKKISEIKSKKKLIRLEDNGRSWLEKITKENLTSKLIMSEPIKDETLEVQDVNLDPIPIILPNGRHAYVRKESKDEIVRLLGIEDLQQSLEISLVVRRTTHRA